MLKSIGSFLLATLTVCSAQVQAQSIAEAGDLAKHLVVSLEALKPSISGSEPVYAKVSLRNVAPRTISFLRWGIPQNEQRGKLSADMFEVVRNGIPVAYLGPVVLPVRPTPNSYIQLAPQQEISTVVNLAEYYRFEERGEYDVRVRTYIFDPQLIEWATSKETGKFTGQSLISNAVTFAQTSNRFYFAEPSAEQQPEGSVETLVSYPEPITENCVGETTDRLGARIKKADELYYAVVKARYLVSDAELKTRFLRDGWRPTAGRYTKWFGAYDAKRFNTLEIGLSDVGRSLRVGTINFSCNDEKQYCFGPDGTAVAAAYVVPTQPYRIYTCPAFFNTYTSAPPDSYASVVLHEMSHFVPPFGAGTIDYAYFDDTLSLPRKTFSIPPLAGVDRAIKNAASYAYFVENVPCVPMHVFIATTTGASYSDCD